MKKNEPLDKETEKKVTLMGGKILSYLDDLMSHVKVDEYTKINLMLNVLTGCIVQIVRATLPPEMYKQFIEYLNVQLKENLKDKK